LYKAKCAEGGSSRKVNKDVQNEIWEKIIGIFKYVYFKNIPQTNKSNQVFKNIFYRKYNIEMVTQVIDKLSLLMFKIHQDYFFEEPK